MTFNRGFPVCSSTQFGAFLVRTGLLLMQCFPVALFRICMGGERQSLFGSNMSAQPRSG
jgi:hypothetical protein